MKPLNTAAYLRFFEETIDFQSIVLGVESLPPFPGPDTSPWYRLYSLFRIADFLHKGQFDAAQLELISFPPSNSPLKCEVLIATWLEAEVGDVEPAKERLNTLISEFDLLAPTRQIRRRPAALYVFDETLSHRWSYLLRVYLTSLQTEISQTEVTQCERDLESARNLGIPEETILHLEYMLRFSLARQFRAVDQVLATTRDWQQLCSENPKHGTGQEYQLEAILALEFAERFGEALSWIDESMPLADDPYELLVIQARVLKRIGRIQESLVVSEHLIAHYPHDFSGYTLRSNANFLLGHYDKAMADAQLACKMDPENPNSYLSRAFVLLQTGQYEKALVDFNKTLEIDPQRYDAMRGQGKCLSMLGRDFEALASFQLLRRSFPDDPDVYYEIADVLFAAGYLDECEKTCRLCLQLDPNYVSAYVILGMIAMRRNDDEKARKLLNQAVEMEPDNPFALNELSYLTHLDGDEDRAIELVDRAIAESPDYADALCNKGVIHYFRSEFDQATQVFDQTLRLMPDHVGALVGKGNTLVQQSEFDEAQRCYDLALEIDPDNLDACHGKIMLYRMLGLDDEVRIWQDRAARLEGEEG